MAAATDPVTNESENGNANVVVAAAVDYTAYPPPPPPEPTSEKKPPESAVALSAAQVAMHEKVLEHFRSESYKVPGVQNGELMEEEKFWLVRLISIFFLFFFWFLGEED